MEKHYKTVSLTLTTWYKADSARTPGELDLILYCLQAIVEKNPYELDFSQLKQYVELHTKLKSIQESV